MVLDGSRKCLFPDSFREPGGWWSRESCCPALEFFTPLYPLYLGFWKREAALRATKPWQGHAMNARQEKSSRRIFQGRRPSDYEHPILLAVFEGFPCPLADEGRLESWELWLRAARSTSGSWWNMKLCAAAPDGEAPGTAYRKANYWLGWHSVVRRFPRRSSDHGKLRDGRPELYGALCETLFGTIAANMGAIAGGVRMRDLRPPQGQFGYRLPLRVRHRDGAVSNAPEGLRTASIPGESAQADPDADLL